MRHPPTRLASVLLATFILVLAGCNAQPAQTTRQRGTAYPAPADVGSSVEPRHVNFTSGESIAFSAFKRKVHSRTTGQAMTLLIEPPVQVDQADAVAQAKFIYTPGPVFTEDLPSLTAVVNGYRGYGSYTAYYARDERAVEPYLFIVPLTRWQLHLLFPTRGDARTLSVNAGRFDLSLSVDDRRRLIDAVATWQPVLDALGREGMPLSTALVAQLSGDAGAAYPAVALREGEAYGAWRVGRHAVTFDGRRYTAHALDQTIGVHPDSGYRMLATIEPAYLHPNAAQALVDRDLQLRLVFQPAPAPAPANAPAAAPERVRFRTNHRQWELEPTPAAPNHFAAHLPAAAVGELFGRARLLQLDVTHGGDTHTYTLDTRHLAHVLNHLPDDYFHVDTEDLP